MTLSTILLSSILANPVPIISGADDLTALAAVRFTLNTLEQESSPAVQKVDALLAPDRTSIITPFGTKGSRRFTVHGGVGMDIQESRNTQFLSGVAWSHFIEDDLSLDLELNGLFVNQMGQEAGGLNFAILFRWHFLTRKKWTMFMDAGGGVLLTTEKVPDRVITPGNIDTGGSRFNFTPQAGMGFTFDIGNNRRFITGLRWYHISNANTFERNSGRDHIYLHFGVSMPF